MLGSFMVLQAQIRLDAEAVGAGTVMRASVDGRNSYVPARSDLDRPGGSDVA
jgi:hypothetical protein